MQNLAEAEYVVALFMYMRLIGYSAESISILTTYNGQKHLIRDVIKQRCADNPFIGKPHKVSGFRASGGLRAVLCNFEFCCCKLAVLEFGWFPLGGPGNAACLFDWILLQELLESKACCLTMRERWKCLKYLCSYLNGCSYVL